MQLALYAAAIVEQLPGSLALKLTERLSAAQQARLKESLAGCGGLNKKAGRAFLQQLQRSVGVFPKPLSRGLLVSMCRAYTKAAAEILSEWLAAPPAEDPMGSAAVLLMSLPPEVSARVFMALGPEHVHSITSWISNNPVLTMDRSLAAKKEFETAFDTGPVEEMARRDPDRVARGLITWMKGLTPLSPLQKAAVLVRGLPNYSALAIFRHLSSDQVVVLARALDDVPDAANRFDEVVRDFKHRFGVSDVGAMAQKQPRSIAKCLQRWIQLPEKRPQPESPPERPDSHLRLVCGRRVAKWLGNESMRQLLADEARELGMQWERKVPLPLVESDGSEELTIEFRYQGRVLGKINIHPRMWLVHQDPPMWLPRGPELDGARAAGVRIEGAEELLLRKLGMALASLDTEPTSPSSLVPGLTGPDTAALAMLRGYHPNQLGEELSTVDPTSLMDIAQGFLHLLKLDEERLREIYRQSMNHSPREFLEQAGLVKPYASYTRATRTALILMSLQRSQDVLRKLLQGLPPNLAVLLTEKMGTMILRRDDQNWTAEEHLQALAEFSEWLWWRHYDSPGVSELREPDARLIRRVWPRIPLREAQKGLQKMNRERLVRALAEFLREPCPPVYVPAMLRAAHFLSVQRGGLHIRKELMRDGYPLPNVETDPAILRQARREWALRSQAIGKN